MIRHLTLYSYQLNQPHLSFSTELKVKDFNSYLQWDITKAVKVTYVNPKGEEQVIKLDKPKRGMYDID